MAIANALIAFIGTPSCLVLGFNFTEALFISSWQWICSELDGGTRLPVIAFLSNGSPLSHLIKRLNPCTIVWAVQETEPEHAWALATVLWALTTHEWNVFGVLNRRSQR